MLHSLEFENFKSWSGHHRLKLGRITGLFGPNSSGKSSIIHLLLLLKQTVESSDTTLVLNFGGSAKEYVDFGSFIDIVTDHDASKTLSYSLDWTPGTKLSQDRHILSVSKMKLSSRIKAISKRRGEEVVVDNLCYITSVDSSAYPGIFTTKVPSSISSTAARSPGDGVGYTLCTSFDGTNVFQSSRALRAFEPLGLHRFSPRSTYQIARGIDSNQNLEKRPVTRALNRGFSFGIGYGVEEVIRQAEDYTARLFSRIVYLGPLRDYPQRNYAWTGATPATVGHRGEEAIQVILADASQKPSGNSRNIKNSLSSQNVAPERSATVDAVTHWLQRLGIAESLSFQQVGRGARIWEARLYQQDGASQANLADVGFGVSQVLPVIVALLSAPSGSLVILEHPEIHLHPRIQSELADLLIEIASAGEIQILLESHSEHLLARIQRRISESSNGDGGLKPEDFRLYFCNLNQGKSKLTPLEVQPSGIIANWPDDFFGDILEDRLALGGFSLKADNST